MHLSIYLSIYRSIYLSVYLYSYTCIHIHIHMHMHLRIHICISWQKLKSKMSPLFLCTYFGIYGEFPGAIVSYCIRSHMMDYINPDWLAIQTMENGSTMATSPRPPNWAAQEGGKSRVDIIYSMWQWLKVICRPQKWMLKWFGLKKGYPKICWSILSIICQPQFSLQWGV